MGNDAMTATTTEQLKEQLEQAQVELVECLRNGADTAPIRSNISRLEGELPQAMAAEQAAASAQEAEEAQAIAEQAADIATEAHANIQARTEVEGFSELTGDQLPAVPRDPMVEAAAARVAAARVALAKAEAAQKPLKDEAVRLFQRLGVKRAAADKIRTRRAAPPSTGPTLGISDSLSRWPSTPVKWVGTTQAPAESQLRAPQSIRPSSKGLFVRGMTWNKNLM